MNVSFINESTGVLHVASWPCLGDRLTSGSSSAQHKHRNTHEDNIYQVTSVVAQSGYARLNMREKACWVQLYPFLRFSGPEEEARWQSSSPRGGSGPSEAGVKGGDKSRLKGITRLGATQRLQIIRLVEWAGHLKKCWVVWFSLR